MLYIREKKSVIKSIILTLKTFMSFRWRGNPLLSTLLMYQVIDFVVDEARHKIFAVAGSPESELVSFAMQ